MTKQLAKNVNLQVIPTKKYKTIQMSIRFATEITKEKSSLRTLLSSLLETNSLNYPTSTAISKKLSDMYGARMGTGTSKKGNRHYFNANFTLVNPKYLPNEGSLLEEGIAFFKEILFKPNAKEGKFDVETFNREKKNLQAYIESIYDDKQTQASLSLQNLYYEASEEQATPSFGNVEDIEAITNEQLYNYYLEMLATDEVSITVLGDVEENEIEQYFVGFPFNPRPTAQSDIMYKRELNNKTTEKIENLDVQQAKLNLAYQTDVYFHDANYFPMQVFNGIFGGFAHSKLFLNVREKESMAYYASSSLDTFRGSMTVQTGIDSRNKDKVMGLIQEQLEAIMTGDISEEEMTQTKAMIRNQYILSQDNPNATMEATYLADKVPASAITDEEWLSKLEKVTKEEVQKMAEKVNLQSIYFMQGGK